MILITAFKLLHKPFGERVSSGVDRLEKILGGGIYRRSCVLYAGEPGTGKTLLASTFAQEASKRGERVLYVSLEESEEALMRNVSSASIDLFSPRQAGMLQLLRSKPETRGAEEHLLNIVDEVEEFGPHHVIVDAVSACDRMGGRQAAFEFLMRLLNYLKEKDITVILVNQTSGTKAHLEILGSGVSSIISTARVRPTGPYRS